MILYSYFGKDVHVRELEVQHSGESGQQCGEESVRVSAIVRVKQTDTAKTEIDSANEPLHYCSHRFVLRVKLNLTYKIKMLYWFYKISKLNINNLKMNTIFLLLYIKFT